MQLKERFGAESSTLIYFKTCLMRSSFERLIGKTFLIETTIFFRFSLIPEGFLWCDIRSVRFNLNRCLMMDCWSFWKTKWWKNEFFCWINCENINWSGSHRIFIVNTTSQKFTFQEKIHFCNRWEEGPK